MTPPLFLWKLTDGTHLSAQTNFYSLFTTSVDKILILDLRAELKRQVSIRSLELAQLEGMSFTDAKSWIQTNTFLLNSVLAKRLVGTNSQDTDVFVIGERSHIHLRTVLCTI